MKHTIEITTAESLVIIKGLYEEHFPSPVDKKLAIELTDRIIDVVVKNLKEVKE